MEVLFVALFFLITFIFFVAGKDDFGRKEIKLKSENTEEVKKDEVKNQVKDEPKEEVKKDEVKNQVKDEPKEEVKKEVE